jgi:hypothetical protein
MALELNIDVCQTQDCKTLTVTDITGNYDPDNITGYGPENEELADLIAAVLTVTIKATASTEEESFTFDVLDEITNQEEITITSDMLGYGFDESIPDGILVFTLEETFEDPDTEAQTNYSTSVDKLLYCNFECFVKNKIANLAILEPECCSGNSKDSIQEVLKMWAYLKSLEHSAACGNLNKYTDVMAIVSKVQGVNDCNCN